MSPHNGCEPPATDGADASPGFSGTTVSPLSTSADQKSQTTRHHEFPLKYEPTGKGTDLLNGPVTVTSPQRTAKKPKDDPCRSEMHRGVPLQFPHLVPPQGQSHVSGRYTQLPEERHHKWVNYKPPSTGEDLWKLPPNVPAHDDHWRGRALPGLLRIPESWAHVGKLVSAERTRRGGVTSPPDLRSRTAPVPTPRLPQRNTKLIDRGANNSIVASENSIR